MYIGNKSGLPWQK